MKYKWFFAWIGVGAILFFLVYWQMSPEPEIYSFSGDKFSYILPKEMPPYQMYLQEKNERFDIFALAIPTRPLVHENVTLHALLLAPRHASDERIPGVVLLPGGSGTKESRIPFAEVFVKKGYAVLLLDQRGIGQTGGTYRGFEEDYLIFKEGKEPLQHLAVYDALLAFRVMTNISYISDTDSIFAGESMGGRYALIAAALESRSAGVIAVSTSGFNIPSESGISSNKYLRSIDPDNYVPDIAPRPLAMIHDPNDSVIPLQSAQHTFLIAENPKNLEITSGCNHGYCSAIDTEIGEALRFIEEGHAE